MRFTKLVVEAFQGIQSAEIEFGPALNVLFGPNDLGKSTLATALRAALLVPPSSAAAEPFTPWHTDAAPRVRLTFVDDAGHYWRVEKRFGSSSQSSALLEHSKDGVAFTPDSRARQVEERLRTIIRWGIPAPGGKGGPRGLPQSFLSNVLLAEQADVDAILGQSLADDPDGSGKLRLTKALATLAQDPTFKRALLGAQQEVSQYFTATGQRKRGQASRFTEAGNQVKELEAELRELEHEQADSRVTEEHVGKLRQERAAALLRVADAARQITGLEQRHEQAAEREQARAAFEAARAGLGEIDILGARVNAAHAAVARLRSEAERRQALVAGALAEKQARELALAAAEDALRTATSEDGARERELKRAQLAERAAALSAERQSVEAKKLLTVAALAARAKCRDLEAALTAGEAQQVRLQATANEAVERATRTEAELALAGAIVAYGRWRQAAGVVASAEEARAVAARSRREAAQKQAEAASADAEAGALAAGITERAAALPSVEQARAFAELERELGVAEAALGGGLSVQLKPRAGVRVHARVDGAAVLDAKALAEPRQLEAERSVSLAIADRIEIEITAGAAEQRQRVAGLRARFATEVAPRLAALGLSSASALAVALGALAEERAAHSALAARAESLRAEARAAGELTRAREQQAEQLAASAGDLGALEAGFAGVERPVLEAHWKKLGQTWEAGARALHAQKQSEHKRAEAAALAAQQALRDAEYRQAELARQQIELVRAADAAAAELGGGALEPALRELERELARSAEEVGALGREQSELGEQITSAVERASSARERARGELAASEQAYTRTQAELGAARAELFEKSGEQKALAEQLVERDRAAAEARVKAYGEALARLPETAVVSAEELAAARRELELAERALEHAKEELYKSEGALSKVGGAAVHEEVLRVGQALAGARERELELELDADAWKLLLETLRGVENEQGAHLGRSLAAPVAAKFAELTGGRYRDFRLDPALRAEALEVSNAAGTQGVIAALSVGTRDQLATLLRLTIADQLRTAIVLDDHLVHTDTRRLHWFRSVLMKTAVNAQIIVLTCRPEDYLSPDELPLGSIQRELAGGSIRSIDVSRLLTRWSSAPSRREAALSAQSGSA